MQWLQLDTVERIQDVLNMMWKDLRSIDGTESIVLIQNKKGKPLWIPLRESLGTLLSNAKRKGETILPNKTKKGP